MREICCVDWRGCWLWWWGESKQTAEQQHVIEGHAAVQRERASQAQARQQVPRPGASTAAAVAVHCRRPAGCTVAAQVHLASAFPEERERARARE